VGYAGGSADPSLHLSALKSHVVALLRPPDGSPPPAELPPALGKALAALLPHLLAIERTGSLLCALFGRLGTFAQLSTPPTACALFTLALEAEARKPLPAAAVWAGVLGARFGCAGSTVQSRYKLAYDIAEKWVSELPWANTYKKVGSRAKTARAKEGKRAVVAQSLKDAVEFQEEIWSKKVDAASKLVVVLEEDEGEESDSSMPSVTSSKRSAQDGEFSAEEVVRAQYSRKRRKKIPKEVDTASAFLLSPSNSASPATAASSKKSSRSQPTINAEDDLCLLTHLLSADPHTLSLSHPPTRLQILATARGGADVDHIRDDELFEEGELENILRPPEEVDAFARTVDWPDELPATEPRRQRRGPKPKGPKGSQRVDMDKLARLLGESPGELEDDDKEDGDVWDDFVAFDAWSPGAGLAPEDDKDDDSEREDAETGVLRSAPAPRSGLNARFDGAEDEEVEEWRPASPGGADGGDYYDF
jgi:transcription factor IIIB 90 kDa subunit